MERAIRFGAYIEGTGWRQRTVSCNGLPPAVRFDAVTASRARLAAARLARRLGGEARVILPLAAFLVLFQALLLRQPLAGVLGIAFGLVALIAGLVLIVEGLREGLLPLAGRFGEDLAARAAPHIVLVLALLFGVVAALSQPGTAALRLAGVTANASATPFAYALLHGWAPALVAVVALSVGGAVVLGLVCSLLGWRLRPVIVLVLILAAGLSLHVLADPRLAGVVELAWDTGAVVTGPLTLALLLGSGTGLASAAGASRAPLQGPGIMALALLVPVLGTLLLGLIVAEVATVEEIVDAAAPAAAVTAGTPGPWAAILAALRAVVPVVVFIGVVVAWLEHEQVRDLVRFAAPVVLCLPGFMLFEAGTRHGLEALGTQSAQLAPTLLPAGGDASHFALLAGGTVLVLFAGGLVFGASRAEPALAVLGGRLADLTHGTLRETGVRRRAALGAGAGAAAGILGMLIGLPATWLLLPGYVASALLTAFLSEEHAAFAWDSAAAAVGPLVAALLLPVALMAGQMAPSAHGILALATLGAVLGMLVAALQAQRKASAGVRL